MRKVILSVALGVLLLLTLTLVTFAEETTADPQHQAKIADIKKLMMMTGAGDMGTQMAGQMVESFKMSNPKVPNEFWEKVKIEVDTSVLLELNIPIYDKYLSHEEIKATIAFYETPVGKKLIEVLPNVADESYQVGQKWGMELGAKVAKELKDAGY